MGIHNSSVFAKFEQYETENPVPRKELDGRTIYLSRPMPLTKGLPALSDLSEARFGGSEHTDDIMPDVYRAPEVVLGMPWSYPIDIWSVGMVVSHSVAVFLRNACTFVLFQIKSAELRTQVWDLFERNRLFTARNPDGHYSERYHLAQMVAILGPPPLDFLQRAEKCKNFWDQDGG